MRIFIVEPNGSGGMIHYAYQIATALANQGAEVTLVTAQDYELRDYPHNFKMETRMRLWDLHSRKEVPTGFVNRVVGKLLWTLRRGVRAFYLIRAWMDLNQFLLKEKPDLVQFGKINFPFEAYFLKRLKDKGLVLTQICHEFERRESSGMLSRQIDHLYNSVFQNFRVMFFHAQENKQRFHSLFDYPEADTYIIDHGNEDIFIRKAQEQAVQVDLREKYGLREDETVLLFFGVLAPSKGLPVLLDAFARLADNYPVRLVVAGYPAKHIDVPEIYKQAERLGILERIVFDLRYIPNEEVPVLFELADLVVYPYLNSTQSGAIQVSYSFGRPVVASDIGGLPEVVDEGQSGLLAAPGDAADLANKIAVLLDDPARRKEMGAYARHLSETRFSWDTIAGEIMVVYQSLNL